MVGDAVRNNVPVIKRLLMMMILPREIVEFIYLIKFHVTRRKLVII